MFHNRSIGNLKIKVFLLFAGIFLFAGYFHFAQSQQSMKEKLLSRKKKIEEEIAYTRKLLEETGKTKKMSLNQLNLLQNQIKKREALLDAINDEIVSLNAAIRDNDEMLARQVENLTQLKEEYARIIYQAWKTRGSGNKLLFIFSARDFNQAYRRLKYFQQYSEFRKRQAAIIVDLQKDISRRMEELKMQKENKTLLLINNEIEKQRLSREKAEKDAALQKLKQQEAEIRKQLKSKQEEARKLQQKIEAIIASEINKSASASKKTGAIKDLKNLLTPEEKILSDNFAGNKGKLPWPVATGIITEYFGEHEHPVLPGIKVKNNGIDISTAPGTPARAVFNGTVTSVIPITANNTAVIIRHGEYFTVYSNLASVNVQKGSKISIKQNIGTIYTDDSEKKTILHFELWEGKSLHNPEEWLAR